MAAGGEPEHHRRPTRTTTAPPRKPAPGQPWSHEETIGLIDAYEEKWYALKRGQLKAQQWEDVAAAIAARCGLLEPSKNGTQCRHKVEKLRKRYRDERLRSSLSSPSPWPYFDRMNRMERGPLPISVRLPLAPRPSSANHGGGGSVGSDDDEDDDDEDVEEEKEQELMAGSNTRSINGILREGNWGFSRVSRNPKPQKKRAFEETEDEDEDDDDHDKDEEAEGRGGSLSELAAVVRRFGEGLVRMEKRRMQVMREMERDWMELEVKRAEMVIESQRCLVEMIAGASSSLKKAKESQDM